jgi:hypothetical protein
MDRDQIFEDIPVFALLGIMVLMNTNVIPPEYRPYLFWGGCIFTGIFILGTEYVFRITASKYLYILLIVRPLNAKLHLFVKEPSDGVHSRIIDKVHQIYETPLTLGEPLKNKRFRNVRQIVIEHMLPWEKRIIALPGKAVFRGYSVDHPRTATLTVWTPKVGQTVIDHLEPIPIFVLAEAPRDYYLATDPVTVDAEPTTEKGIQVPSAEIDALKRENDKLKIENVEWKRYGFHAHQELIEIEGEDHQVKNEFRGVLGRTRRVSGLVLEELLTVLSAHTEIEEAVSEYRTRPWIKVTIGLALLILGIFAIYEFSSNEDVRTWISNNTVLIIVIAVCAVFMVSFLFARRRK